MKTAWKIKLNKEITSELLLTKAKLISAQITKACLINGKDTIKIPTKLINIIDINIFEKYFNLVINNETDKIFIYRSDIFNLKHFIQKNNDEIVGAGVKFTNNLFNNEEFIENRRMCGEIELIHK